MLGRGPRQSTVTGILTTRLCVLCTVPVPIHSSASVNSSSLLCDPGVPRELLCLLGREMQTAQQYTCHGSSGAGRHRNMRATVSCGEPLSSLFPTSWGSSCVSGNRACPLSSTAAIRGCTFPEETQGCMIPCIGVSADKCGHPLLGIITQAEGLVDLQDFRWAGI